jgi:hypothetical protein
MSAGMRTQNGNVSPIDFFLHHPVFTHEGFVTAHTQAKRRSRHTSNNLLALHLATGRLVRVRRVLYATVPRGVDPKAAVVDPYLVVTKLADDVVVAYHAALQFHGKAYSASTRFTYLSYRRARLFRFRQAEFVPVQLPAPLRQLPDAGGGMSEQRYE